MPQGHNAVVCLREYWPQSRFLKVFVLARSSVSRLAPGSLLGKQAPQLRQKSKEPGTKTETLLRHGFCLGNWKRSHSFQAYCFSSLLVRCACPTLREHKDRSPPPPVFFLNSPFQKRGHPLKIAPEAPDDVARGPLVPRLADSNTQRAERL